MPATYDILSHTRPTIQLLMPMGGLGSRFADTGVMTPKPLIPLTIDGGEVMVLKAVSSFEDLFPQAASGDDDKHASSSSAPTPIAVRVIFVVRQEHEEKFGLRTQLLKVFSKKYNNGCAGRFAAFMQYGDGPQDSEVRRLEGDTTWSTTADVELVFIMMHANTNGAAETCLLASSAILPAAPLVILDCDLYVRSRQYNRFLRALALRSFPTTTTTSSPSSQSSSDIPPKFVEGILGLLVFFNSKAPRYSYAQIEPLLELEQLTPPSTKAAHSTSSQSLSPVLPASGGRVIKTAEKVPISNCALIGAYCFARGSHFIQGATKLVQQPINPDNGLKEYYISLVFNFLLRQNQQQPEEGDKPSSGSDGGYVLAVPMDEYHSFGTPDELSTYNSGNVSYVRA